MATSYVPSKSPDAFGMHQASGNFLTVLDWVTAAIPR